MSTVLTREAIKATDDRTFEPVEVPEWGGMLYVRGLSGIDRDDFELKMIEEKEPKKKGGKTTRELNLANLRAKLIVRTAFDSDDQESAKPIFTLADVEWLGTKSGAALQRVYTVAQRLSGLSAEDVDELTDELGNGQSDSSGSDSPKPSDTPLSLLSSKSSVVESSPNGEHSTESTPSEVLA